METIRPTYNIIHHNQNKRIILKSYVPVIDSWIGNKRCYIYVYEKLVNKLHDWIDNHTYVIPSPNIIDSFFKENVFLNRRISFNFNYMRCTII